MIKDGSLKNGDIITDGKDTLTYTNYISIANQPIYLFLDSNQKEIRLNKFDLRRFELNIK